MGRKKEQHPVLKGFFQALSKQGGKARAAKLSPERRSEIASAGAIAQHAAQAKLTPAQRKRGPYRKRKKGAAR